MNVNIELVRKPGEEPYFLVSTNPHTTLQVFSFRDHAAEGDIWNKEKALNNARDYALILKSGITETRTLIETL